MNPLSIQTSPQGMMVSYKLDHQDIIDKMTMGMLRNNKIKGIVPIDFSQIDSERWIKYDVSNMQPLQTYLTGILTRKKILNIFSQIVETFLLAEDYMIDASFIVLDSNYIFVQPKSGAIGIICLPISGFVGNVTIRDMVGNITRLGQFDSQENCDYVTKILNFVNGEGFSITGFKKILDELLGEGTRYSQPLNNNAVLGETVQPIEIADGEMAVTVESVANMRNNGVVKPDMLFPNTNPKGGLSASQGGMPIGGIKKPNMDLNSDMSGTKMPKEKKKIFRKKNKKDVVPEMPYTGMVIPGMQVPDMGKPIGTSGINIPPLEDQIEPVNSPEVNVPVNPIPNIVSSPVPTTFSDKPEWKISPELKNGISITDNTIMLKTEAVKLPRLVRMKNGEERVIDKDELFIGKATTGVDYCISDNTTVSRIHAIIIRRGSQYFIKDNNSMNHTYVDGKQMISGQEFPIVNGSKIRFSNEEFTFKQDE